MKSVTQLAMFGAGILILTSLLHVTNVVNLMHFDIPVYYTAINALDLLAYIAIFAFFYKLYQKQNNKSDNDEPKGN